MKSKMRACVLFTASILLLSACTKEADFDAVGYVESVLDATYHEEYEAYADFIDMSEKEAKENMEQDFMEGIEMQFTADDNISEEGIVAYAEQMRTVNALARYKVLEAEKTEDGNYVVKVQTEPSNVYQSLAENSREVSQQKIGQGLGESDPGVLADVLTESIQKSVSENTYGKAVAVEVAVTKDDSGAYALEQTEQDRLFEALFPQ